MITESEMYWMTRLDGICAFFAAMIGLSVIALVIMIFVTGAAYSDGNPKFGKMLCKFAWVPIAFGLLFGIARVLTPTTKEYAAIRIVPAIANNETLQKDCNELYKLTIEWAKNTLGKDKKEK